MSLRGVSSAKVAVFLGLWYFIIYVCFKFQHGGINAWHESLMNVLELLGIEMYHSPSTIYYLLLLGHEKH
jgi:hypothetical protein